MPAAPIIRHDTDETYDRAGNVLSSKPVDRDVTADAVTFDLAVKLRAALTANQNYLGAGPPTAGQLAQQVTVLTRQVNALLRLLGADLLGLTDLLGDNAGT